MDRKILWEKWYDPLSSALDDYKSMQEELVNKMSENEHITDEDILDRPYPVRGPVVFSPMGPIPLHESNLPSKIFNFWIGHTNFDLTKEVCNKIETVPGVEVLNVWTRYRFRLGIGKNFVDRNVMTNIDKVISNKIQHLSQNDIVNMVGDYAKRKYRQFNIGHGDDNGLIVSTEKLEKSLYEWDCEKQEKTGNISRNRTSSKECG